MTVTFAIPDSPEAMQEFLTDKGKKDDRAQIFNKDADPADTLAFMNNYAKLVNKSDPSINEQLTAEIDRQFANFVRENGIKSVKRGDKALTASEVKASKQTGAFWSKNAAGATLDGKFESIMDLMEVISSSADPREQKVADARKLIKNAMSSTDPSQGGFLIPEEFRRELLTVALEKAIVRPRARVIPMASLRASIPMIDATSNVSSVYGGIIGYWTEEGAALTQSQPNFGRITLEAKKLTAYTEVPRELRDDSAITIEALLGMLFPDAIRRFEDIAFLRGTGVGEPTGVLSDKNAALVTQGIVGGQGAATILWENLIGMYSRMLPDSLGSAVWMVPPAAFPELATMALSVGTGGSAVWLGNGVEGPPATILGRPVIITEMANTLGAANDVSFVDFNQYLIGDRMAMQAESSEHFKFGNDVIAYRFIQRVDGRPWMQSAITPANNGPTLSPYVGLAARP